MGFKDFLRGKSLRARNDVRTSAAELTLRQSLFPIVLVTTLFFLWGFSYGRQAVKILTRLTLIDLRPAGYSKQAFPERPSHHKS